MKRKLKHMFESVEHSVCVYECVEFDARKEFIGILFYDILTQIYCMFDVMYFRRSFSPLQKWKLACKWFANFNCYIEHTEWYREKSEEKEKKIAI